MSLHDGRHCTDRYRHLMAEHHVAGRFTSRGLLLNVSDPRQINESENARRSSLKFQSSLSNRSVHSTSAFSQFPHQDVPSIFRQMRSRTFFTHATMPFPTFTALGLGLSFDSPQSLKRNNPFSHLRLREHRKSAKSVTDGRGIARFDTTVDAWRVAVSFYILLKIGHIKRKGGFI